MKCPPGLNYTSTDSSYCIMFLFPACAICTFRKQFCTITKNSPMAVGLHTMGIMSKVYRISCTLSGAFCTVRIHGNSKDIRKVLESCSVVRILRSCRDFFFLITTDKWTSEIDLSFGIKLAESQSCNSSEIWSQFVTNFHSEMALFGQCMILVWFLTSVQFLLFVRNRIFFTWLWTVE